jgi:hypothetical protein
MSFVVWAFGFGFNYEIISIMKNGWLPCLDPLFWRGGSGVALLGKVERSCLNIEVNCPRSRLRLINNHIGSYISSMVVQRI